jgi:hypothetical protein
MWLAMALEEPMIEIAWLSGIKVKFKPSVRGTFPRFQVLLKRGKSWRVAIDRPVNGASMLDEIMLDVEYINKLFRIGGIHG